MKTSTSEKVKIEVLERDGSCIWCGGSELGLHMHHVFYHRLDKMRYSEYRNEKECCVILCGRCHNMGNTGEGVHTGNKEIDQFCRDYLLNLYPDIIKL